MITRPLRAIGCPHDHVNMAWDARAHPLGAHISMYMQIAIEVKQASGEF
ncbi:MAG: hypothetical protein IT454_22750 [Planctomycetes bacterium]|nr:hypothetical protein [Planctomycetota bacterium]